MSQKPRFLANDLVHMRWKNACEHMFYELLFFTMSGEYYICDRKVEVLRKDIRYLRLTLYPNGLLRLSVPKCASRKDIQAFLEKKSGWLRQKLVQQETVDFKSRLFPWDSGHIFLWGKKYKISLHPDSPQASVAKDESSSRLDVHVPRGCKADLFILQTLVNELEEKASLLLPVWQEKMGLAPVQCTLRFMKSRWGSCTPARGAIRLNAWLFALPPECLEYVLVHELCHFREKNHGAGFYKLLQSYLPDWKERKRKLSN